MISPSVKAPRLLAVIGFVALAFAYLVFADAAFAEDGNLTVGRIEVEASANSAEVVTTYRMYNPYDGEHHYTQDANERDVLAGIGWTYEGVGWNSPVVSSKPLFRLYNQHSGEHHYTQDAHERDVLAGIGWSYEGIAWYSDESESVPLYRLFNPYASIGTHHYTASVDERDFLAGIGWRYEGIAWYGTSLDSDYQRATDSWSSSISGDSDLDRQLSSILVTHGSLRSAFDYVAGYSYRSGNKFNGGAHYLDDGTTVSYAKEMLAYGSGNCYRFASLFSWLARGLGYSSNVVSGWVPSYSGGQAPHGWAEIYINGQTYVCDPDLQHEIGGDYEWYMSTYDDPPTTYGSW